MQDDRTNGSFTIAGDAPGSEPGPDGSTAGRALIVVGPAAAAAPPRRALPRSAPFLAQLIATRLDLPATRARRRASPATAAGLYRQAGALR